MYLKNEKLQKNELEKVYQSLDIHHKEKLLPERKISLSHRPSTIKVLFSTTDSTIISHHHLEILLNISNITVDCNTSYSVQR